MTRAGRDGGTRAARAILSREMAGAVFIILVGSTLHFVFDWTGGWRPAALFAAVNESIWEHLKLAFWPGLAWALLPSGSGGAALPERLAVRGYSLALTAILIVAIFRSEASQARLLAGPRLGAPAVGIGRRRPARTARRQGLFPRADGDPHRRDLRELHADPRGQPPGA